MGGENNALAEAKAKIQAQFGDGELDGPDPDLDGSADSDLDEELDDDADSADTDPGSDEDGAGEADADGDEPDAEAEANRQAAEETDLLGGEKLVKLPNGEFISKKSFLKRLKAMKEKNAKELEEKLAPFKGYQEKQDHYKHWDTNHAAYKKQSEFMDNLRPVLGQDAWLAAVLKDRMAGNPTNWQMLAQHLKPMLAPYWDGIETVEADPSELARQEVAQVRREMQALQQSQQQQQHSAQEQQRVAAKHKVFATQEAKVWASFPEFKNKTYRELLLAKAADVQADLEDGVTVDLTQVANSVFGELRRETKAKAEMRAKAKAKAQRAGGEGGARLPHIPAIGKLEANAGQPTDLRKAVAQKVLAGLGNGPLTD